ncbi:MAG: TlpA family protein disulfide reductase [Bacteroidales bacterium]|nr:TlpA family protein disulfide reductase [Bacteroidales bacterium]
MKTKTLLIGILIVATFTGCNNSSVKTDKKANDIVFIFKNVPTYKGFTFPSGLSSGKVPPGLILYINNNGLLSGYNPPQKVDTFKIKNIQTDYLEVLYQFQGIEDIYYLFRNGDTIEFTCGKNLYPHVKSYTSEKLTKQYNFQANIKDRQSKFGFESFTLLTYERLRKFMQLKTERPDIYNKLFRKSDVDFMSVDTLKKQFQTYIQNYQHILDSLYQSKAVSDTFYQYYNYLLRRKEAEASIFDYLYSRKKVDASVNDFNYADENNHVVQISSLYHGFFNDSLIHYISYDRLVQGFIWDILCKAKNVKVYRGTNRIYSDTRTVFDNIDTLKNIPPETKNLLRFYSLESIIEDFPVEDIQKYLSKYTQLTHDSIKAHYLIKKNNLDFKTSNDLLLKNEQGTQLTFKDLLKQYKGKVIYVDFWASWCEPCRRSMPAAKKLREAYKNKKVAFVYLAKNDQDNAWKKAIRRTETNYLGENYFIVNSTVSKILEEWKVYSIPRYMIFDKKGHLVYKNAPGPGSEAIRKILDKYLNERLKP